MKVDTKPYHAVYLSPHLDDVVLSCGGQIYQQTAAGKAVLIVTLMAGDPPAVPLSAYAQSLHDRWELDAAATAERRAEDAAACRIVGADYLHLEISDCIYRRHTVTGEPLYTSDEMIFGEIHPNDVRLAETLATHLGTLPAGESVFVPLTVGHHVDHQLTRLAAEIWQAAAHLDLIYYEDYPYARESAAVERVLQDGGLWQSRTVPLSTAAVQTKIRAISAFVSQLSTFFADAADLERQIIAFTERTHGEKLWQREQQPKIDKTFAK